MRRRQWPGGGRRVHPRPATRRGAASWLRVGFLLGLLALGVACEAGSDGAREGSPAATVTVDAASPSPSPGTATREAGADGAATATESTAPGAGPAAGGGSDATAMPGFDDAARAKLAAPLLLVYEAATASPRDETALEALAQRVELTVEPEAVRVGVLVQTSASDAALRDAGLTVSSRVASIAAGRIDAADLPALAALPEVTSIEPSTLRPVS